MKFFNLATLAVLPLALSQSNSTTPGGPDQTTQPTLTVSDTSTSANYSSTLTTPTSSPIITTTTTTSASNTTTSSSSTSASSTSTIASTSTSSGATSSSSSTRFITTSTIVSATPTAPSQVILTTTAPGGVTTMISVKVVGAPTQTVNQPAATSAQTGTLRGDASTMGSSVRGAALAALVALCGFMGTL